MTWLWNSWKISILAASFNLMLAAMAAYAFSRFRFRGRRLGLLSLLLVQVFPQYLMFIAICLIWGSNFVLMKWAHIAFGAGLADDSDVLVEATAGGVQLLLCRNYWAMANAMGWD